MRSVRITCTGRVQGVFYRASTQVKANELHVKGWVRNEANGDVEIYAVGEESAVQKLILWCEEGPELAKVDKVFARDVEGEGADLNAFEIRR